MLKIKKYNKLLIVMVFVSILLTLPSIFYLIRMKTIRGYTTYYSYTLTNYSGQIKGIMEGICFISLLLIFSFMYFLIIKKEKEIFKSFKHIIRFIFIISIIFTFILPILSSDIFYYIGDSWLLAKYKENPYYTSVQDLLDKGISDEILEQTGCWKNTTSVYGPVWNYISSALVMMSFGSITIALFIYKSIALLVHILICCIIYKTTNDRKHVLLYGLNPLVLIEMLSNVHNDIYLLLFVFFAIYFVIKKKNIFGFIFFISLSIATKYSSILLVPFLLLYYYNDKPTLFKRIIACINSGIIIIGIVILLYMPYYRNISIFTNMLVQNTKYSQSITALLLVNANTIVFKIINASKMPIFVLIYIICLIQIMFEKNIRIENVLNKVSIIFFVFIFFVLTTFQQWYVLWIFPVIFFSNKKLQEIFYILTVVAFVPSILYFKIGVDAFSVGIYYSVFMLGLGIYTMLAKNLINRVDNEKQLIHK